MDEIEKNCNNCLYGIGDYLSVYCSDCNELFCSWVISPVTKLEKENKRLRDLVIDLRKRLTLKEK